MSKDEGAFVGVHVWLMLAGQAGAEEPLHPTGGGRGPGNRPPSSATAVRLQ